jgi:hypothetical protein
MIRNICLPVDRDIQIKKNVGKNDRRKSLIALREKKIRKI